MFYSIDPYNTLDNQRIDAVELAELLCKYDVISFDVFGTLVLRPFSSPRVLFSIMEKHLGIYKFSEIRVKSEDEVRQNRLIMDGHDNTTIREIYDLIAKKTNLNAEIAANMEYELELSHCLANPYFEKVVSLCKKANKKIVICSDMYLSQDQIQGILRKVGFSDFDGVFVSSEWNRSKKRGDLFETLKDTYPELKIIHVGDDLVADIENAEKAGICTYYYENVNTIGGKNRIDDMSYITGRVYSSIVNNHFYCENTSYSEEYRLGYIYGGIYVLGFTQWINRFVNNRNVDKVLFLSRDGDVYSQIFDMLPGHQKWEYFYWSRLAGAKITAMENFYEFCQRMIWHKARGVYNIKIGHVLNFFDIGFLSSKLNEYGLSENDVLSNQTAKIIEGFFFANKDEIINAFQKDIQATFDRIKETVGTAKKIVIVDVGWAGTGPLILKKVIRHYLQLDCEVYSLLAGYRQPIENMASLYTMDDSIYSYLFSINTNRDLLDQHCNRGFKYNNLMLEIFTQSCTPSFIGYTSKGMEFDWDESQNYETIRMITDGIRDFAVQYIKSFRDEPFLLNISPYDAYLPFSELVEVSDCLEPILDRLVISRGKFYDAENTSKETWLSFFNKEK